MIGINLHHVVRPAITLLNPDEDILLYQSLGQKNVKGKGTPLYSKAIEAKAQIQPLDANSLAQTENASTTPEDEQAFVYSSKELPVAGIRRKPFARTGDFIKRDGLWYLVTAELEDFSSIGWANVRITLQITPPDFSMSEDVGDG